MKKRIAFMCVLVSLMVTGFSAESFAADDTLCTPNPSEEAVALYRYLLDMKGERMLSGQMFVPWGINELEYLKKMTGKQPAIMGVDFIHQRDNAKEVQNAISWWNAGGIPTIMWHWGAPAVGEGYVHSKDQINIDNCFIEGTEEYKSFRSELDAKADLLEALRDAHVPVLWRPYHELNGNWFWWGKQGPEKFIKLWRTMFDYFVQERKLNNLIWVLCYTGDPDGAWYPGDAYVDIAGADTYNKGNAPQTGMYNDVKAIIHDRYPITYHECGIPPDPDQCLAEGAMWSWWMQWHTGHLQHTDTAYLNKVYHHHLVITLDEVPDIMSVYGDKSDADAIVPAQTEVMAWGNITGIRVDGQLMEFETSIRVAGKEWNRIDATGKERRRTQYDREGQNQIVNSGIAGLEFTQTVKESGKGSAVVTVNTLATKDTSVEGIFYCIDLPDKYYAGSELRFLKASAGKSGIRINEIPSGENARPPLRLRSDGFTISSPERTFDMQFDAGSQVYVTKDSENAVTRILIALTGQKLTKGQQSMHRFTIKAGGVIDSARTEIVLDPQHPGSKFEGFGGNFRLQNPRLDPLVIKYCLDNLRVAWGRVEMPWQLWHPDENASPIEAAQSGNLHPHVRESMEMAQKLAEKGIPIIISDWAAPSWAILGDPRDAYRNRSKGIFGYQLNPDKMQKIYASIADYLVYLKQNYGVEPVMFSFNESDLGINVRHTGKEHADFIKGIGAYFASRGIATKLLLGDNSDATTFDFIIPALNDPETHKYIGAVSFHSWRGCDDATLEKWAGGAKKMNLPLIVAEGSTDAAAWNYPEIFLEQPFALYEINLYIRLCSFCQPLSILQWQLTSDYSVLAGNGIFGTKGRLRPTRRFWNLKQLASTPEDAFSIPVTCDKEAVNCAAFGNIARGEYAVHMVNNGAARNATIKGLPASARMVEVYVTDETRGMEKTGELLVRNGTVEIDLAPAAFITLITKNL